MTTLFIEHDNDELVSRDDVHEIEERRRDGVDLLFWLDIKGTQHVASLRKVRSYWTEEL